MTSDQNYALFCEKLWAAFVVTLRLWSHLFVLKSFFFNYFCRRLCVCGLSSSGEKGFRYSRKMFYQYLCTFLKKRREKHQQKPSEVLYFQCYNSVHIPACRREKADDGWTFYKFLTDFILRSRKITLGINIIDDDAQTLRKPQFLYNVENRLQYKSSFRPACVAASHWRHVCLKLNWFVQDCKLKLPVWRKLPGLCIGAAAPSPSSRHPSWLPAGGDVVLYVSSANASSFRKCLMLTAEM